MSLREDLVHRTAAAYADFLIPLLTSGARVLDVGCGSGSITIGLAQLSGLVVGLDLDEAAMRSAASHVEEQRISNAHFAVGDAGALPFAAGAFDALLMHSVLEAAADPRGLLREAQRVLVLGGVVAIASVEYGGRILAGPHVELLESFYSAREALWAIDGARPRAGRDVRRALEEAGFSDICATAHYFSYGTPDAVRVFGEARASECGPGEFASKALANGLLSSAELAGLHKAWLEWASSPKAFTAFAWCRAVGRRW